MIEIRLVSDLRNKSTDSLEIALNDADKAAVEDSKRMSHEEVFSELRRTING